MRNGILRRGGRLAGAGVAVGLLLVAGLWAARAVADEKQAHRLFVADHEAATTTVLDAASGETLATFELKAPARLHATGSGKTVFAIQRDADLVSVIASGIAVADHGDHGDIKLEAPRLTGSTVAGKKPVHFVEHGGNIALFFDDEGVARFISEDDALAGKSSSHEIGTSSPHHGVAIPFGAAVLMTEPHGEKPVEELPIGIKVVGKDNAASELHACPDLHGEATSGRLTAIACESGLLIAQAESGAPAIRHLPYDADLPKGKVTTLVGGRGLQYFLGNWGPSAVVFIDPEAEQEFRLVELPARRVHFEVDSARPRFAYVLTEDGQLHRLDVLAGTLEKSLALTEPYSMDGHWSDPRPRIAVASDTIFVTDPLKGKIHRVNAETFEAAGEISLPGKPYNIVAVGGAGESH